MIKQLFPLLFTFLFIGTINAQQFSVIVSDKDEKMREGKFEPNWESLKNYEIPEWFKKAKFGIWAHWGPQCVEGSGDWMARKLYIEGSEAYNHHVKNYGHPSEFGFKDVINLWKAEKWDPEKLVAFYKKIGAQYFFAMGNHHDNMDLWDSKYQPWNSANMGPKRDILGEWEQAARKHNLPFGISFHADHAWTWYETTQRHDLHGDKAGIPYDGKLSKADGKGKWWEGYDPQDLYAQNHPMSENSWDNKIMDKQWDWGGGAYLPTEEYCRNFYNRTLDAISRYNPDLIYFDTSILPLYPFSDTGLKIAAHYYNHNMLQNNGKLDAVLFGKQLNDEQRETMVWDVEKGGPNKIMDKAWQSCSCIGEWHYKTAIYENNSYKSASKVIHMLVDIVSKNGNLLLSIPLRADGTFDEKEAVILEEVGNWMTVNKECIYDTSPWLIFREGGKQSHKEARITDSYYDEISPEEIRFTQTENHLYVITLGWPEDSQIVIKSLSLNDPKFTKPIEKIELLGYGNVKFERKENGLRVFLPKEPVNNIASVLKISK